MQRMFSEGTDWRCLLAGVLPNIIAITGARPKKAISTRFIPARRPGEGEGMWKHYYKQWASMTIDELRPEMVDLVSDLAHFVAPARAFDKHVYSPWTGTDLHLQLRRAGIWTVTATREETDVCVLATMLGAIERGLRVILVTDALCTSADETRDAMMNFYLNRFGEQVECVTTAILLEARGAGAGTAVAS
jgi:nicotinamidase-related amidase